jgi:hypothetical protein
MVINPQAALRKALRPRLRSRPASKRYRRANWYTKIAPNAKRRVLTKPLVGCLAMCVESAFEMFVLRWFRDPIDQLIRLTKVVSCGIKEVASVYGYMCYF